MLITKCLSLHSRLVLLWLSNWSLILGQSPLGLSLVLSIFCQLPTMKMTTWSFLKTSVHISKLKLLLALQFTKMLSLTLKSLLMHRLILIIMSKDITLLLWIQRLRRHHPKLLKNGINRTLKAHMFTLLERILKDWQQMIGGLLHQFSHSLSNMNLRQFLNF